MLTDSVNMEHMKNAYVSGPDERRHSKDLNVWYAIITNLFVELS